MSRDSLSRRDGGRRVRRVTVQDELAAIRERCEKADTAPWRLWPDGWEEESGLRYITVLGGGTPDSIDEHCIANVSNYGQGDEQCEADAEFIAHARTDVPFLLDALEEAIGLLRPTTEELAAWEDSCESERPREVADLIENARAFLSRYTQSQEEEA